MTNRILCDRCKGLGKVKYKHIADGLCFQCEGLGSIKVSSEAYEKTHSKKEVATYVKVYEGIITDVVTSSRIVEPDKEKDDNLTPEYFTIGGNNILYKSKWNSFTKKNEVYSSSFKVVDYANTLEIVTRLIIRHYKDELNLWNVFESMGKELDHGIRETLNSKVLNAKNEAIEQLEKFNLTS